MLNHPEIQYALSRAWHKDIAANSLERWLELSQQEGWEMPVDSLTLLTSLLPDFVFIEEIGLFICSKIIIRISLQSNLL